MNNVLTSINSRLSNAKTLIRYFPIVLKEAMGIHVLDMNKKKYIDCISAAGSLPFGHNHFIASNAIQEFINRQLPVQTMDIATEVQYDFLNTLYKFLPHEFSRDAKIQMCSPSGGDAVDAAIKLAKVATGRSPIIAFYGGYHGQGYASSSISGKLRSKYTYSGMSDVHFLPYPNAYRCPFQIGAEGHKNISDYIECLLKNPQSGISKPAAVIFEAVQGEGGVNIAPNEWIRNLRKVTKELDIPLIADEVQTGFCRTGKKFAFEHAGITPDIVCVAKAIGGSMPLAAIIHNSKLDKWNEYQHAGTWRGNQMGFLLGMRTMEYMEKEKLWEKSHTLGDKFIEDMKTIQHDYPFIGDVRGKGLIFALEMVKPNSKKDKIGSLPPNINIAKKFQEKCLDNGLLILRGGPYGNVIRIIPPLTITNDEIDEVLHIIKKSLREIDSIK
jgi:diaminobutyrate-2-oxoglutarate transaminase